MHGGTLPAPLSQFLQSPYNRSPVAGIPQPPTRGANGATPTSTALHNIPNGVKREPAAAMAAAAAAANGASLNGARSAMCHICRYQFTNIQQLAKHYIDCHPNLLPSFNASPNSAAAAVAASVLGAANPLDGGNAPHPPPPPNYHHAFPYQHHQTAPRSRIPQMPPSAPHIPLPPSQMTPVRHFMVLWKTCDLFK